MRDRWLWAGLVLLLLLWPGAAWAGEVFPGADGGRIFVDEDVVLEPSQTFSGDLGILNGNLDAPGGSQIDGDVFVAGGDASIGGSVNGNLAVIKGTVRLADTGRVDGDLFATGGRHVISGQVGGNVSVLFGDLRLGSTALVEGDLLVAAGHLEREPGAQVRGSVTSQGAGPPGAVEPLPEVPEVTAPPAVRPAGPTGWRIAGYAGRALMALFGGLGFAAMCVLVTLFWPRATGRVAHCIAVLPAQSLGLGLLTYLLALGLELVAVVAMVLVILAGALLSGTVVLLPVGLLLILLSGLVLLPVPVALLGGMVLGWAGLADLVGRRVLGARRARDITPLGAVLVGLLCTLPIAGLLWIASPGCCAWPFVMLLTSFGVGSAFHTRFGRQECRSGQRAVVAEAPAPEPAEQEAGQVGE